MEDIMPEYTIAHYLTGVAIALICWGLSKTKISKEFWRNHINVDADKSLHHLCSDCRESAESCFVDKEKCKAMREQYKL
jgi:hypothetical protein